MPIPPCRQPPKSILAGIVLPTEWELFKAGFASSDRGNPCREWDGLVVTVFWRRGGFCWCISNDGEPEWSSGSWHGEEAAMVALWRELQQRKVGA